MSSLILIAAILCAEAGNNVETKAETKSEAKAEVKYEPSAMAVYMHQVAMQHRSRSGLAAQKLDAECCAIAQRHADWMARNNSMTHGGGEQIIAMGQRSPEDAMLAWMNSSGHRFWMLSGTSRAGWGCQRAANGTLYWAGCFRSEAVQQTAGTTSTAVAKSSSSGTMVRAYSSRRKRGFRRG